MGKKPTTDVVAEREVIGRGEGRHTHVTSQQKYKSTSSSEQRERERRGREYKPDKHVSPRTAANGQPPTTDARHLTAGVQSKTTWAVSRAAERRKNTHAHQAPHTETKSQIPTHLSRTNESHLTVQSPTLRPESRERDSSGERRVCITGSPE